MKIINLLAKVLILVGALNWGLVGALNFDLVAKLLGHMTAPAKLVYCLVGLSAVYKIFSCVKGGSCSTGGDSKSCCR